MRPRIVLSIFATILLAGCLGTAIVADDHPADDQPACGIGTSPAGCAVDAGIDAAAE